MRPWEGSRVDQWKPARKHPETYPGDRPPGAYLLLDDRVYPLELGDPGGPTAITSDGEPAPLDEMLERARLPGLDERVAVLAYGGNRNPATLRIKLQNYRYQCPGDAVAIPVLRGTIDAADVAACSLSGQGYLFGDLLVDPDLVGRTRCEVWLALVDADQLRVLHESEIGTGDYVAARFPGVRVNGPLRGEVLGYAARRPCFVSPELHRPLAFGSIEASGRSLPEMTPMEMLDHVFGAFGLADEVRAAAGADSANGSLGLAVARYMNRNWWLKFTGHQPDPGYGQIMSAVTERVDGHALEHSTASVMAARGMTLTSAEAHSPDASLTWGRL